MHSQTRIRNQFLQLWWTSIRNHFFKAMMELKIWAKRVELRWHAMIWQQIPSWIPRWLPYTFRTHSKCSWNDTRLSNLQKHALHCHSSCHDQISSCFLCNDMITKILWYEIMNTVSRVKSSFLSRLCIGLCRFNFQTCTWYDLQDH